MSAQARPALLLAPFAAPLMPLSQAPPLQLLQLPAAPKQSPPQHCLAPGWLKHLKAGADRPEEVVHKGALEHVDVHDASLNLHRDDVVWLRHGLE